MELFGIDKDYEPSLAGWVALTHPDDRAKIADELANLAARGGGAYNHEFRIVRPSDGVVRWMRTQGRLEVDEFGEPKTYRGAVQDITERRLAEVALRESEESLKEAQRIAGIGSFVTDLRTGAATRSEVLLELIGVDRSHEAGKAGWAAVLHPDDRMRLLDSMSSLAAGNGGSTTQEFRIVRPLDGAVRWMHSQVRVELDELGKPQTFRGTIQDITERKLADSALRESKELLQLLIEHAPVSLSMFDREMRYLAVSRRCIEEYGLAGREVIGRSHYEMLPWVTDELKETHRRALRGETIRCAEDRIERPGGTVWMRWEVRPWRSGDGEIGGIILFTEDISEQKKAEAALRESKELLQLFIDRAPASLAMLDCEMRYVATSRRWLEMHSLGGKQIIGRSHYEFFPGLPESWKADHRRALAGEALPLEEKARERADGSVQWLRREIIPWRQSDGAIGGIILFSEDITWQRQAEAALRESKELLQLFIAHAPAGLAMFDREMRYVSASRRWLEMHALLDKDVIGRSEYEVFPELSESWREEHRRAMAGESLPADERYVVRPSGLVQWIRREIIPWRTADGTVGGIIIFADDITRSKESEQRLRLAASVFTNAREGIMITDPEGNILEVNEMFTQITGYSREEALGKNPQMLKSGLQSEEFYANMWRSLVEEGHWSGEIWNKTKSGEIIAETLTIDAVRDATGKLLQYVSMFADVTALKQHERELEHVTYYDVLTSLPNRALFADRLRQAMTLPSLATKLLAVAYLDLDGFKVINDLHGHGAGDRMLTTLAFNMKCALRKGDTLARLGGDEFVAVMLDLESTEASMPALNRLLEAAAETVQVGDLALSSTASIGVAFYPQKDVVDADSLLRQADQAMYQAKLAGGNRYHIFDPDRDEIIRGRHENIDHIRRALAAREFVLYYQPKVNMRTGKVVGAEALIRWQHPERGLIPPGMFLPVIEEHPLAIDVGEWVIETALAQIETWRAAGLEMPVSVNVGALQLQQANFVEKLTGQLAAHPRVKPFDLELEVLETSALQDMTQTSQVLSACHEIGVSFAIDDFGTGYSSLTYLKRLPASILKIDQSFVGDMLEDPENLNILEGILGLGSAFHRQVIAEGVETVEHGLMLLRLGCELAQGYGIARPMPAGDIPGWVAAWRPDARWAEVPPVHSGNRTLLYACVEHRAWIAAFDAYLLGKRHAPPGLDQHQCRFGAWLDIEGQAGRSQHAAYRSADGTHRQFHEMAAAIVAAQAQGRNAEGVGRLGELHALGEDLLEQLETLIQWS